MAGNVSNGQVWTTGKDEITIANLSILCPLFLYISFFLPFSFTILQNVISYYLDRKLVVIPREREREKITRNQSFRILFQNYLFRDH